MKNRKLIVLVSLVLVLMFAFSAFAFAAGTFQETVKKITNNIRTGATVLIILSAVITAILFMASSVNPKMKDQAKGSLLGLIFGVILLVLAGDIANLVSGLVSNETIDDAVKKESVAK